MRKIVVETSYNEQIQIEKFSLYYKKIKWKQYVYPICILIIISIVGIYLASAQLKTNFYVIYILVITYAIYRLIRMPQFYCSLQKARYKRLGINSKFRVIFDNEMLILNNDVNDLHFPYVHTIKEKYSFGDIPIYSVMEISEGLFLSIHGEFYLVFIDKYKMSGTEWKELKEFLSIKFGNRYICK